MPCTTEVKPVMDKAKKKRLKKYIAWVCMVAVVALLAAMPLLARRDVEANGPVASILQGQVTREDLQISLQGGGTLSAAKAENVELPKGVKITEFLVGNGDLVSEGDPVARVDKVSVMTAIVEVRDTLDYLREEMHDARDEKAASSVKATAGGRVKQVFAQSGDSVQTVMLRHGALAVLSLDGLMAVELEADTALAAGDPVKVTVSGAEVSGRVESNLNGTLVVTVEDEDYAVGEPVTVTGSDGTPIGSGSLDVHNAWKATAYTGTVGKVYAKENTDVRSGANLFTLKDTDFAGTQESLASLHREYEEVLQKLFAMYESEVITAPCDGKISGVKEDSEFLLAATEDTGWTFLLLSEEKAECTVDDTCQAKKGEHEDGCPMKCTDQEGCKAAEDQHNPGCAVFCTGLSDCANPNHKTGCLGVCTGNELCQSTRSHEHHLKSCIKRCVSDVEENASPDCDADIHYDACLNNCTEEEGCEALTHKSGCYKYGVTYVAYAAKITHFGTDKVQVLWGTTLYDVTPEGKGWKLVNPDKIVDQFPGDKGVDYAGPALPQGCGTGDTILLISELDKNGNILSQKSYLFLDAADSSGGMPGFPGGFPDFDFGDLSGLFAGMGGMMGFPGGMPAAAGEELYDLQPDVLMTVTAQDTMTLSVSLDEKDISKVSLGQKAQVKVNPLKGRTFEAEITDIDTFGMSSGGSSKFAVELTLALEKDMISGMSAVAYIPLYTKTDVLTVPVAALVEEGSKTLICKGLDPETGDPANPVEVTTGVSDGEKVEILSGLSEGETFHYSYYDILEVSTDVETDKYTFG